MLFKVSEPAMTVQKVKIISDVIASLLKAHFTPQDISRYSLSQNTNREFLSGSFSEYLWISIRHFDLLRLGLFLVYTLPPLSDEGNNLCESDLSEDTPGTFYTHPHHTVYRVP